MDTYDVLYNTCYGGFDFPTEFIEKVFKAYPPNTELGKKIWKSEDIACFIPPDNQVPTDRKSYYKITEYEPFCDGFWRTVCTMTYDGSQRYECNSYITDKTNYYHLSCSQFRRVWRTSPEIIQMARQDGFIGKDLHGTYLAVAKVPVGYEYSIREYDGMETVFAKCPTEEILAEMVELIQGRKQDAEHPLTQKLLENVPIRTILYPKIIYEGDDEDSE